VDLLVVRGVAVGAAGAASLGAGAERLVDNGLDGTSATAAFGTAAEAAIDLLGIARHGRVDGIADIMVAEDVAGTDDHECGGPIGDALAVMLCSDPWPLRYSSAALDAKGKTAL